MTNHQRAWTFGVVVVGLAVFTPLIYVGVTTYIDQNKDRWAAERKEREERKEADRLAAQEAASLLEKRKHDARNQVEEYAEKLHGNLDPNDKHKYVRPEESPPSDPWGHPLIVRYKSTGYVWKGESVTVISAGPDGKVDSSDDIIAERKNR